MWSKLFVFLALINFSFAGSACQQAPFSDLQYLADYAPAQQFCAAHYPQPTVTVTVTKRAIRVRGRDSFKTKFAHQKRATPAGGAAYQKTAPADKPEPTYNAWTPKTTPTEASNVWGPKTTPAETPTKCDQSCSAWSSCTKNGDGFMGSLCRCMWGTKTRVSLLFHSNLVRLRCVG